jgi:hypothetical protein
VLLEILCNIEWMRFMAALFLDSQGSQVAETYINEQRKQQIYSNNPKQTGYLLHFQLQLQTRILQHKRWHESQFLVRFCLYPL